MDTLRRPAVAISLHGDIDIDTVKTLRRRLAPAETADEAIIDLSQVTYAGTTLINGLLDLRKRMLKHGAAGAIHLVGSSPHFRKVLTITKLDRIFQIG